MSGKVKTEGAKLASTKQPPKIKIELQCIYVKKANGNLGFRKNLVKTEVK